MLPEKGGRVLLGAVVMLVLSIGLSWLPFVGPFIAGAVGGFFCRSAGRALLVAVLPAFLLGVFVWWVGDALEHAIAGFLFGVATMVLVLVHEAGLVAGALVGGLVASNRRRAGGPGGPRPAA